MQESIESKVLGQRVEYPKNYAPHILVGVPRCLNRSQYGIDEDNLNFVGCDIWHAYEVSFLTELGLPVVGVMKIKYASNTPKLVESKSLKLYLNSFNMEKIGKTPEEGRRQLTDMIAKDLSAVVGGEVNVNLFNCSEVGASNDWPEYDILENHLWARRLQVDVYNENPELLEQAKSGGELRSMTHLLRSNCKITHQPDWGTAFVMMKGKSLPTEESLLKYIISIRNENHFHEEICEMIYTRLWDKFAPEDLVVTCVYTRRGGVDICPSRASRPELLPKYLSDERLLTSKLCRQ